MRWPGSSVASRTKGFAAIRACHSFADRTKKSISIPRRFPTPAASARSSASPVSFGLRKTRFPLCSSVRRILEAERRHAFAEIAHRDHLVAADIDASQKRDVCVRHSDPWSPGPAPQKPAPSPRRARSLKPVIRFREPGLGHCRPARSGRRRPRARRASSGMLRIVACVSVLIWASHVASPHQGAMTKPGTALHRLAERVPAADALRVLLAERQRALEQRPLDVARAARRPAPASPSIGTPIFSRVSRRASSTCDFSMSFGPISSRSGTPRSSHSENFQPGRSSRSSSVTRMPAAASSLLDLLRPRQHRLAPVLAADRHDDDLIGRQRRRQHQAAVVAVRHDDAADEPRRDAPRRAPHVLHRLVARLERDVERLREVLSEVVRRAGLQRAAVAHQRLDRVGADGAGELLALALLALDDRHREHRLAERRVEVEDHQRLGFGLFRRLVRRVPFLPEELGRAQERPRDLLPAHDVGPLVDQDRQIAPRLHPLRVHRADDGLGRRPDDELLFELLASAVRDVRHLRREAFDVLGLLGEQRLRE